MLPRELGWRCSWCGSARVERPELAAADEHAQARPWRAAELFGERHRFGTPVELRVDQDGCPVLEQEADIVNALAIAGGADHRTSDERRHEGRRRTGSRFGCESSEPGTWVSRLHSSRLTSLQRHPPARL